MPAYIIVRVDVTDPAWVESYSAAVPGLVAKHGGRYLVRSGEVEQLEEAAPKPQVLVVLEFPSVEKAKAFYADPEYQPHLKARLEGTNSDMLLAEGV